MTRALITNDDGIEAEGLRWLARTAVELGFETVVAAPLTDSSGTSTDAALLAHGYACLTALQPLAVADDLELKHLSAPPDHGR